MADKTDYIEIINEGVDPHIFAWITDFCRKDLFSHDIGVMMTKIAPGKTYSELATKNYHANLAGSLHGGVTATLADLSMGIACFTTGFVVVTTNLNISYMDAGKIGEKIKAVGHVIRAGKSVLFSETTIEDEQGLIIAKGSGIFSVISRIS